MPHQVKPSTAFADGHGLYRIPVLISHLTSDGPPLLLPFRVVQDPSLCFFCSGLRLLFSVCLTCQSQDKAFKDKTLGMSLRQVWSWLSKPYPGLNISKLNSREGWSEEAEVNLAEAAESNHSMWRSLGVLSQL